jgi:glycine cleavage system H protein
MAVVLVLMTFGVFLLVDWYLVREHRKVRERELRLVRADADGEVGPLFHPGHGWIRLSPDGTATLGVSEFAAHFAGDVQAVELPEIGRRLRQGGRGWTFFSSRDRRLDIPSPIDGTVVEVNRGLGRNPRLAQEFPYDAGWTVKVRPKRLARGARNLLRGETAGRWLDAVRDVVTGRLGQSAGAVAYDGGAWAAGFGDDIDDRTWRELRLDLFAVGQDES